MSYARPFLVLVVLGREWPRQQREVLSTLLATPRASHSRSRRRWTQPSRTGTSPAQARRRNCHVVDEPIRERLAAIVKSDRRSSEPMSMPRLKNRVDRASASQPMAGLPFTRASVAPLRACRESDVASVRHVLIPCPDGRWYSVRPRRRSWEVWRATTHVQSRLPTEGHSSCGRRQIGQQSA